MEDNMENRIATSKALLAIFLPILVLDIAQGMASLIYLIPISEVISPVLYAICYVVLAYWGVKLLSVKVIKLSLQECRIDKPHIEIKWLTCAIVLPIAVMTILLCTPGEFVHHDSKATHAIGIIITAVFVYGIGPGIVEEIIFRGLIMKALEKRWGKRVAILIPSIIFGLLHAIGANLHLMDLLMLFVGGTSVGIMFSLIVYKSGSVWNSAIVHGIWNIIMIGNIFHVGTSYNKDSIFSYKLLSHSFLLTGGAFGVEVSIVAILGYLSVIALIQYSMKKKQRINEQLDRTVH